jgi:cytochrome P450
MADYAAVWREARETGPVVRTDQGFLLTRYADVHAALRDPGRFSSDAITRGDWTDRRRELLTGEKLEAFEGILHFQQLFIADRDDPEHARLRRIVHRVFTPRRIAQLTAATERYTDEWLTNLSSQSEDVVDFTQLSYRVPLLIIGDLVGVPREDQGEIKKWADEWGQHFQSTDDGILAGWEAQKHFRGYIEQMIERHRDHPEPGDLVAALLDAQNEEVLTVEEFAALFFVFLIAGHETTTNLLATGLLELMRQRDQWQALCDDPELIPNGVEELLRLVTPAQWVKRRATEDVVVAGCEIPAESYVLLALGCANRDPEMFPDPDAVDVRRENASQHVALGHGIHFCLGSSLARLEGEIVFRQLTRRFPELELADENPAFTGFAKLKQLKALPVRFGPERTAA